VQYYPDIRPNLALVFVFLGSPEVLSLSWTVGKIANAVLLNERIDLNPREGIEFDVKKNTVLRNTFQFFGPLNLGSNPKGGDSPSFLSQLRLIVFHPKHFFFLVCSKLCSGS
jgi:hypothetical protein